MIRVHYMGASLVMNDRTYHQMHEDAHALASSGFPEDRCLLCHPDRSQSPTTGPLFGVDKAGKEGEQ